MMRNYLSGAYCKEAFSGMGSMYQSFNDMLRFHDATRFQLVEFSDGETRRPYHYTLNKKFLREHCERLFKKVLNTGKYKVKGVEDDFTGEYLVRGKDIALEVYGSSLEMVVDVHTVTQEDIEAVLGQFYKSSRKNKARIFILVSNKFSGYYSQKRPLENVSVDLENSYGEGFVAFHEHVVQELKDQNGLVLLHGLPGTGKTTYIKHLSSVVNRDFIFIPEVLSDSIDSPELLPVLLKMHRPVIIVEDAEKMLASRDKESNNKVSSILNLSNGILGDYVNASVICTFNSDLQVIDKALLREGRLIGNWEFGKLDVERCRKIAAAQGITIDITQPLTVSEVLNHKKTVSNSTKKPYRFNGFVAAVD
jgi:hypothetical protein